jgi:ABC-2 type transport system permease protein
MPLLTVAMIVGPSYLESRGQARELTLAVVDETGVLAESLQPRLEEAGYVVERVAPSDNTLAWLTGRVGEEELGGFLLLDAATLETGRARLVTSSGPSLVRRVSLQQAVLQSALEAQLSGTDVDIDALTGGGTLRIQLLRPEGRGPDDPEFLAAYIGAFVLYMIILIYGMAVMRSTVEEKSTRIVEVVLASLDAWHLMLGKILGVGAVALTQVGIWVTAALVFVFAGLPVLASSRPGMMDLEAIRPLLPGLDILLLFLAFFTFGFFMFASLYAAVGATCNNEQETQMAQQPVIIFIVIPVLFLLPTIDRPGAPLFVWISRFPLFSPVLMYARAAVGAAAWWEIALSFVLMAATVVGIAWVAGRIYKVGILMAGKRPTVPEIIRWIRVG